MSFNEDEPNSFLKVKAEIDRKLAEQRLTAAEAMAIAGVRTTSDANDKNTATSAYSSYIKAVPGAEARFDDKFNRLEVRLDRMEARFDRIETRFDRIEAKFDRVEANSDRMDGKVKRTDKNYLADDLLHMRSNSNSRFELISEQLRLVDRAQFRTEDRLAKMESKIFSVVPL